MLDGPVGVEGDGETPAEGCRDRGGAHPPRAALPLPPRELKLPREAGGTYPLGPAGGIVGLPPPPCCPDDDPAADPAAPGPEKFLVAAGPVGGCLKALGPLGGDLMCDAASLLTLGGRGDRSRGGGDRGRLVAPRGEVRLEGGCESRGEGRR